MIRTLGILAVPLVLAGCGSGPSVTAENASVAEVAAKVEAAGASGEFVSPGRWEGTVTMAEMRIPGMPPEVAAKMKGAGLGKPNHFTSCLTPEQAKRPKEDFFGGKNSGNCRYEKFAMAGGKIDAVMTCGGGGPAQRMAMTGTYSPDAYRMTMTSTGGADAGAEAASMTMTMDAKRTGACDGTEPGARR